MLHQIKAPQFYTDLGLQKTVLNPLANSKIQGLFKAFECSSSTFKGKFSYPTLTQIMDSFSCSPLFLFIYLFIYFKISFQKSLLNKLSCMLLDVLGKIAWVRYDFLSQGKISDILIRCARNSCPLQARFYPGSKHYKF